MASSEARVQDPSRKSHLRHQHGDLPIAGDVVLYYVDG